MRVINNGTQRVVNREGTMTIYYDDTPDGDLTTPNPDSFRDGTPVLVMSFHHQVILDVATGIALVTFVNTVTSSDAFRFDPEQDAWVLFSGRIAGTAVAMAKQ